MFLLLAVGTATQVTLSRFGSRRVVLAGLCLFSIALIAWRAARTAANHPAV